LIKEYSEREQPELAILRLTLSGVIDPQHHARLDELRQIVKNRYHPGSSLDADAVLIEPNADELAAAVGTGVLGRVLERLQADAASSDPAVKRVADRALNLLYQITWEARPA
jgi:hypothetical protein